MRSTLVILITLLSCTLVQAQQWRLVKKEQYIHFNSAPYHLQEYEDYYYSGNRGFNKDTTNIPFDNILCDRIDKYSAIGLPIEQRGEEYRTYDANDRMIEQQYYKVSFRSSVKVLTPSTKYTYSYNSNGKPKDMDLYDSYSDVLQKHMKHYRTSYSYDANNNKTYAVTQGLNGATPVMIWEEFYTYNAGNRMLADSIVSYTNGVFSSSRYNRYTYDAAGNLATQKYYDSTGQRVFLALAYHYIYDAKNRLVLDSTWFANSSNMSTTLRFRSYTYDTNDRLVRMVATEDSSTAINEVSYSYTPFGRVDGKVEMSYSGGPEYYDSTKYYYSIYWPANTSTIASQNDELIAYPVPSSNFINLKWEAAKPTTIHARIVNLQGQIVKQWSDDAAGTYTKSIHVGSLPAGNYIVIFEGGGELLRKEVSILH